MLRVFLCVLMVGLFSSVSVADNSKTVSGLELLYSESEPGIDPYVVRMLVTADHLRIDDGEGSDSYVLFERKTRQIVSVSASAGNVLDFSIEVTRPDPQGSPQLTMNRQDTLDMPRFGEQDAIHAQFLADGELCFDVVAVPNIYPEAVAALSEYLTTMSGYHLRNLEKTPVKLRDPCMLANLLYTPARHLQLGLPLRQADYRGVIRELQGLRERPLDPELFRIDDSLSRIPM